MPPVCVREMPLAMIYWSTPEACCTSAPTLGGVALLTKHAQAVGQLNAGPAAAMCMRA